MKHKSFLLSILALILIACAVIKPAAAYFTDNTTADGAVPIEFSYRTEIHESFKDWLKTVKIKNILHPDPSDPEITSDPIWVRVRGYCGSTYVLTPSVEVAGDWVQEGEWWVYQRPLEPDNETTGINFAITGIPAIDAPEHPYDQFNVAVVYESILVRYDTNGDPIYPSQSDWTKPLDNSGNP